MPRSFDFITTTKSSWEGVETMRRNDLYDDGIRVVRSPSLLSLNTFEQDVSLFPLSSDPDCSLIDGDIDPYAPLSINEGITLSRHLEKESSGITNNHVYNDAQCPERVSLSDRSESSSIPSHRVSSQESCSTNSHNSDNSYSNYCGGYVRHQQNIHQRLQEQRFHNNLVSLLPTPLKVPSLSPTFAPLPFRTTSKTTQLPLLTSSVVSPSAGQYPLESDAKDSEDELNEQRFKPFHEEKWALRYKELLAFHKENGHAAVPHTYPPNPQLARWVKRQRRQYKLRGENKASTMTTDRLEVLKEIGFIWDSHDVNWQEKLTALAKFRKEHDHCNVPSNYKDKKLATWVKCQRRQYKLYWDGKPSSMSESRIQILEKVGFEWEIRSASRRNPLKAARKLELTR